jgi:hypothetical protein
MCHETEITLWKADRTNYKVRFSINPLSNDKFFFKKLNLKRTKKINLSLSGLTRKTHNSSYETMITL